MNVEDWTRSLAGSHNHWCSPAAGDWEKEPCIQPSFFLFLFCYTYDLDMK